MAAAVRIRDLLRVTLPVPHRATVAKQLGKEMGWLSPVLVEMSWRRLAWPWAQDGGRREMLAALDARSLSRLEQGAAMAGAEAPPRPRPGAPSRSATGLLEAPQAGEFGFFPSYTTEDVGHSSPILSSPRAKNILQEPEVPNPTSAWRGGTKAAMPAGLALPRLLRHGRGVGHILEDPDLRKLLNDSSMLNLSFLPSNWFNNGTGDSFLPLSIKITIVVVYSIVCIVGLVGNCSVMYVIVRFTKMKTATNIYIFNLALADTLCLMTLPFQGTDTFLGFWPFGNVLCKIAISIDYYNMFTSTFTLTMMSVDRYIAICHPIKALDIRTPHKAKVVNVCIWALASVFGIPAMVMGSAENENNEIDCLIKLPSPVDYWDPVFGICVFLFSFMIPVLIITICYSLMIRRLKNVRVLSGSKEKDRNLRRITRMVLVVVAVFIICWTPIQIFVLVQCLGAKAESELELAISCFCTALGYANSSLNPVLYAFLDENFKACFKKFCFPTAFRTELQMSNRMCSIAKDVAYACKNSEGTNNPA
ncbi:PREDICTED: nociceptin receptor [Nipponia nippon]|nr:PREDICTED: nociceptin receptor [Nipponia nippon]